MHLFWLDCNAICLKLGSLCLTFKQGMFNCDQLDMKQPDTEKGSSWDTPTTLTTLNCTQNRDYNSAWLVQGVGLSSKYFVRIRDLGAHFEYFRGEIRCGSCNVSVWQPNWSGYTGSVWVSITWCWHFPHQHGTGAHGTGEADGEGVIPETDTGNGWGAKNWVEAPPV